MQAGDGPVEHHAGPGHHHRARRRRAAGRARPRRVRPTRRPGPRRPSHPWARRGRGRPAAPRPVRRVPAAASAGTASASASTEPTTCRVPPSPTRSPPQAAARPCTRRWAAASRRSTSASPVSYTACTPADRSVRSQELADRRGHGRRTVAAPPDMVAGPRGCDVRDREHDLRNGATRRRRADRGDHQRPPGEAQRVRRRHGPAALRGARRAARPARRAGDRVAGRGQVVLVGPGRRRARRRVGRPQPPRAHAPRAPGHPGDLRPRRADHRGDARLVDRRLVPAGAAVRHPRRRRGRPVHAPRGGARGDPRHRRRRPPVPDVRPRRRRRHGAHRTADVGRGGARATASSRGSSRPRSSRTR